MVQYNYIARFAWLPTILSFGDIVWLRSYTEKRLKLQQLLIDLDHHQEFKTPQYVVCLKY